MGLFSNIVNKVVEFGKNVVENVAGVFSDKNDSNSASTSSGGRRHTGSSSGSSNNRNTVTTPSGAIDSINLAENFGNIPRNDNTSTNNGRNTNTNNSPSSTNRTGSPPFRPKTLLEQFVEQNTKQSSARTINSSGERFTPRTIKNDPLVDSLSTANRFRSLTKEDVEQSKKNIEEAKRNPNSFYYQQNYKKRFHGFEKRGYQEGVTRDLNELYSGLKEVEIRKNVKGSLTDDEAFVVKGMRDYESNSSRDAHDIGKVNEYGFAPVQFMSEQDLNNYMYIRGKYDSDLADLYYLATDAYHKYRFL